MRLVMEVIRDLIETLAGQIHARTRGHVSQWVCRDLSKGPADAVSPGGSERLADRLLKDTVPLGVASQTRRAPVSLVGAGPGSRDLITLRGVQRLQEADVICYDRLIDPGLLDLTRPDAERIYVGKAPGCHSWPQDKINDFLVATAKRGQRVVRLKCGDPGVFARGAEEAAALQAAGIEVEIVPGVTAASAAAAATGTFLTERGRNDTLVLTTAHKADHSTPPGWINHLSAGARVAVYMGVSKAPEIQHLLEQAGLAEQTEVDIVSQAETAQQTSTRCVASELAEVVVREQVANPAILFFSILQKDAAHCDDRGVLRPVMQAV
jgi:uroporphyrin-III C-methyltransferase/precorrin-2 dehydrogenase/sirohydrochlorin ferrochelatase